MNDNFIPGQNLYNLQKFQKHSTSTKNTVKFGKDIEYRNYGT